MIYACLQLVKKRPNAALMILGICIASLPIAELATVELLSALAMNGVLPEAIWRRAASTSSILHWVHYGMGTFGCLVSATGFWRAEVRRA